MANIKVLWADDEIDLLKPHVLFLQEKGYDVTTANSGDDALDFIKEDHFDIIFLDENMPGLSGLETLSRIKTQLPSIPVIMITKSEEESIMEDAIGSKISDYLIKPVNPKQILLSIKKNLDHRRLVSEKTTSNYQQEFREIGMTISDDLDSKEWAELYKKLVYWGLELDGSDDKSMLEVLQMQKSEANNQFTRFIKENYLYWLNGNSDDIPNMSHTLLKNKINPLISDKPLIMVVIDNLRYDQWVAIRPLLQDNWQVEEESIYYSILPTVTHYARNALFAGLMPSEIEKKFPKLWHNDDDDVGKNLHEEEFLEAQLKRLGRNIKVSYNKITNLAAGKKLADNFANLRNNDLNVVVYNFVDMLSHARTEMEVIKELAENESAYRSLTLSWFEHSPLFEIIKKGYDMKANMVITTDHGSVHVKTPVKVVGEKEINSNLRYKQGKTLNYNKKEVFEIENPQEGFLPRLNVSQRFIFAQEDSFFVYPNNYNYYSNYYKDTFQHGGVSMEEMLIPFISLTPKL